MMRTPPVRERVCAPARASPAAGANDGSSNNNVCYRYPAVGVEILIVQSLMNLGCEGVRESYYPQSDGRTAVATCDDTQLLDALGGHWRTVVDPMRMLSYCVLPT